MNIFVKTNSNQNKLLKSMFFYELYIWYYRTDQNKNKNTIVLKLHIHLVIINMIIQHSLYWHKKLYKQFLIDSWYSDKYFQHSSAEETM